MAFLVKICEFIASEREKVLDKIDKKKKTLIFFISNLHNSEQKMLYFDVKILFTFTMRCAIIWLRKSYDFYHEQ